jgi:hypothetical protein
VDACLTSINPIAKCKDLLQIIIIIPVMVGVTEAKTKETHLRCKGRHPYKVEELFGF